MTTAPATISLLLDTQFGESVPGPEVNGGEVCCGNEDGVDDKAESLGSMPNPAPLDADMPLEHSIELPIELWEKVIDYLADEWVDDLWSGETYEAKLRVLGRVCQGWYARCRSRGLERLDVWRMDKKKVYCLINALNQDPERCHAIKMVSFNFRWKSMSIFGTFAVCMAQKLPQVKHLVLGRYHWELGQPHAQIFDHVTLAFESITVLDLMDVEFPSAVVFGRLVRALPQLSSLKCWSVTFRKRAYVAGRIWQLHPLRLDAAEVRRSDDVVDFLVSIGAQLRHFIWRDRGLEKCQELLPVIAESLSSMRIDLAPSFSILSPQGFSPPYFPIDLTSAVNLRVLSISSNLTNLNRAVNILCRASLLKLIAITIISTFTYTETFSSSNIQDTLDKVGKYSYALLDQAFSSRQYPALKKVAFELHCRPRRSEVMEVISEVSWGSHLSSNLPALYTSGRLV
ncbi:uncharacterized protein FIBRA_09275 [Fibroporia radiculosa]|uniref:F-box domain-containing protein n=1 Tax=Fibroporia radiculosa TaxID=599839 RepID=J7SC83_9APHY|nr:uncharacterized protein FIBRA_09275 [Fibroporia radiculosa]CCM06961.1 predicted protein [Fibroporia radiculosa]